MQYATYEKQIKEHISGKRYQRTSIVAARQGKNILAPLRYSGTMDHMLFEDWFANQFLPVLSEKSYIVLDTAAFHCKKQLALLTQKYNHKLAFLTPYSPQLNPKNEFKHFDAFLFYWSLT